ncbi:unnamed protein product [Soboliphyme baturini]|uniref:CSD domain-containing protein n=1 Tax=Soboliphyme baturini TaxID=241478 RepID=A0A183I9L8_9BILA|nr:unnamed protein product [Soboliphyme baturini]
MKHFRIAPPKTAEKRTTDRTERRNPTGRVTEVNRQNQANAWRQGQGISRAGMQMTYPYRENGSKPVNYQYKDDGSSFFDSTVRIQAEPRAPFREATGPTPKQHPAVQYGQQMTVKVEDKLRSDSSFVVSCLI